MTTEPILITGKQASQRLGISRTTLWRWQDQGLIEFVKIGKHVRFKSESLQQLIQKNTQRGPGATVQDRQ
jgi:excisionase family DNA binding protein